MSTSRLESTMAALLAEKTALMRRLQSVDEELAAFNARNGPVEKQASSAPVLPMLSMKTNLA